MTLSNIQTLMDKIFDIKEKISDQENTDLCNLINEIRIFQADNEVNDSDYDPIDDDPVSKDDDDEEFDPYDVPENEECYNIQAFRTEIH